MAQPGTYTAYRQLKPLEGDVSQDIQQQEENGFRRRALKLAEDRFAQDKADAIEAKKKPIKSIDAPVSEYASHTKRVLDLFNGDQNFIGEYVDTQLALQKDPYNSKLIEKNINMENTIEQIANAQKGIAGKTKALSDGLNSGELSPFLNKDYTQNYNSLIDATGYSYKFNKDTGVTTVVRPDANGDGIPDEFSLQDAYDPTKLTAFKSKFKDTTYLEDAKKRYGKFEDIKDGVTGNYLKTVDKGFDPNKIKDLNLEINSIFGSDVSKMTDQAKSYLADTLNVDPSKVDEVTFSAMKRDFSRRLINSYDTTKERSIDSGDQNADQSRAQEERHFQIGRKDKKDKEDPGPVIVNTKNVALPEDIKKTEPYLGKDGKTHQKPITRITTNDLLEKGYTFPGSGLPIRNIGGEKTGLNNLVIKHVFKGKDGGMYFVADILDSKSSKSTDVFSGYSENNGASYKGVTRKATGGTASLIAKKMGYNSEDEALNHLDELNGIDPNKPQKAPQKEDLRSKYNY